MGVVVGFSYIDEQLVVAFKSIAVMKFISATIIAVLAIIIVLRLINIQVVKGRGVKSELKNVRDLRSRDEYILKINKAMNVLTSIVEKTTYRLNIKNREYLQYNLNRASIKAPGGYRVLLAEEYNAIIKIVTALLIIIGLVVAIFKSTSIGLMLVICTLALMGSLPMVILRGIVAAKDKEIVDNFLDYYLMIHYILISGASTPLDRVMRSYAKITLSEEMRRFIDNCVSYIETYGEYEATTLIAKDYREIAEVNKLMRLIRQLFDGSNVEQDLVGFRSELIKRKQYQIEDRMNKLVSKARLSFNVLIILLIQAILSAMSIYLPDISMAKGVFGM